MMGVKETLADGFLVGHHRQVPREWKQVENIVKFTSIGVLLIELEEEVLDWWDSHKFSHII